MKNDARVIPAAELAKSNKARFPNESDEYRKARNELLAEEIELRRHLWRVAAQRRALPPGGEVKRDYRFVGRNGEVGLEDLFGDFTEDYVGDRDADMPAYTVFTRRDGCIRHFYSSEGGFGIADPGQDPHNAPDMNPLWILLDTTPEGRGTDWYPRLDDR